MIPLQIDTCILKNDVDDITVITIYDIFKAHMSSRSVGSPSMGAILVGKPPIMVALLSAI